MSDLDKAITELKKDGITILKNVISSNECKTLKNYSLKLQKKRFNEGEEIYFNDGSTRISNYFIEKPRLTRYLSNKKLDAILSTLLGKHYVLRGSSIMNVQDKKNEREKDGTGWHTDWSYNYDNIKFGYGGSFHVIIALDDFNKNNGSTHYVKGSHKLNTKPKRENKYKSKMILMKKGSMAIFDSSIWHKSGNPSNLSRWGIWSAYTQWWVKPHFRYNELFSKKVRTKFNKKILQILHLNSTPPLNAKKRLLTVVK